MLSGSRFYEFTFLWVCGLLFPDTCVCLPNLVEALNKDENQYGASEYKVEQTGRIHHFILDVV